MQNQITDMIVHMAKSQEELANIIEAKRHIAIHLSALSHHIPHENPGFGDISDLMEQSLLVTKSITSYLNSLADLEDALTENLTSVIKELEEDPGEE
ncbi:hypothetical protein [Paenibacillus thalictri]|uniref:Nucleoside-diphosphate sugar epimerase n=1 Tax=Paenibacillus thalictri TaxID=2527873 RepID=A0A4Q9DXA9_9BACL|nr:hypothetical protein [Paenibacillus thalictri]TBL81739.1 hypothetical protein EYB31_01715 [Paenibacillus thalictri]